MLSRSPFVSRPIQAALVAVLLFPLLPQAASAQPAHDHVSRNFDARAEENRGQVLPELPEPAQAQALAALRAQVPDLLAQFEPATGTVRTLYNATGVLADAHGPYRDLYDAAVFYVEQQLPALGLEAGDLDGQLLRDVVHSPEIGMVHLYFEQQHEGIPVYNGQLQVNMTTGQRIVSVNNDYAPGLSRAAGRAVVPQDAAAAAAAAAEHFGLALSAPPVVLATPQGAQQTTVLSAPELSSQPIEARLAWLPIRKNVVRLVWNLVVHTPDGDGVYDVTVDAANGKVWTRISWVADATYKVYQRPVESPNHTSPLPPSDGRVTLTNPQSAATNASPNGWHSTGTTSYTIMRGNNVHAYDDRDGNNAPPSTQPSCGSTLACSFAMNLSNAPSTYTSAAVANLFYWNNVIHDVLYQYGFTEAAGNFQVNNFGKGGVGGDDVMAEAQDNAVGGSTNNANFFTPPEGQRPRMQMFEWTHTSPRRDSDLDSLVIVHEYAHGLSNRLVGGPTNVSCLGNQQQPGEGWSDWYGLVLTAKSTDTATQARGVGTYVLGQATSGTGIRTQRYSTSSSINTWTYQTISTGVSVPHGVGAVWAQGLWEVYWKLVGKYGFDTNIYNAFGGKGNTRALRYVTQGLKNTVCSPTFLQARDGIIQAAQVMNSGADVCLLWEAFAAYGLGSNATTGGSGSLTATNGFQVPTTCQPFSVTISGPTSLSSGQSGTWTAGVVNAPGTVTYQWYYRLSGATTWTAVGTGSSYTRTAPTSNFELKVDVTSGTQTVSDTHAVTVTAPNLSVTISGPSFLFNGDFATWTASVSGASGTVTYKWFHKSSGSSTWTAVGTNSPSYSRTVGTGSHDVRVDVTTSTQAGTDTHTYWAEPTCGEFAC